MCPLIPITKMPSKPSISYRVMIHPDGSCPAISTASVTSPSPPPHALPHFLPPIPPFNMRLPPIHPCTQCVGVFRLPVGFILQLLLSYPKLKLCIFCFRSTINQYPEYLDSQVDQDFDGSYSDIP